MQLHQHHQMTYMTTDISVSSEDIFSAIVETPIVIYTFWTVLDGTGSWCFITVLYQITLMSMEVVLHTRTIFRVDSTHFVHSTHHQAGILVHAWTNYFASDLSILTFKYTMWLLSLFNMTPPTQTFVLNGVSKGQINIHSIGIWSMSNIGKIHVPPPVTRL